MNAARLLLGACAALGASALVPASSSVAASRRGTTLHASFVADFMTAAQNAVASATQPAARMQQVAFIKPVSAGASNWVVQLGAYDTAAIAKEKWMNMAGRSSALAAFPVLTSQATVKGRLYHRLAVSGFASRADAMTACRMIRSQRGQCFVRETAPNATPQRWAIATKGRQFASR